MLTKKVTVALELGQRPSCWRASLQPQGPTNQL